MLSRLRELHALFIVSGGYYVKKDIACSLYPINLKEFDKIS